MHRAAFYLACGSAVASLVSIAVCQILMGGALLAILASRERLRLPPIALPLGFFLLWTLLAVAVSDDPRAGLPQVKKFFVYLMLPIIFTAIRRTEDIRHLIWWWAAAASVSGLWSFVQFWTKKQTALAQNSDFYLLYVGDRVTGLMSHWMTFGAVQMTVLSLLLSLLLLQPAASIPMAGVRGGRSDFRLDHYWMDAKRVAWSRHRCGVFGCRMEAKVSAADSTSAYRVLVHLAAICPGACYVDLSASRRDRLEPAPEHHAPGRH